MGRILSIWLPQLPLDRLIRKGDPRTFGAFAITSEVKNAARLTHLSSVACKAGLSRGLTIPDARAICPDLLTEPSDLHREQALLRALWRWADQLSPRVAFDPPDGLLLDISGCAHLFGGEEAMGRHAVSRLADMQIVSRIGIADTKGASRALARFGPSTETIAAPGKTRVHLANLPVAALDLNETITAELAQAGLKTIDQLYRIQSSELARRFGLDLTTAIFTASGQQPDPVTPAAADPLYAARMTLPDPIGYTSDLENVLRRLGDSVCGRLEKDQKGARRFKLTVRCVDTGDHTLSAGFARPCFKVGPLLQQFAKPLDDLKIEFGADWFRLEATHIEPVRAKQLGFGKAGYTDENVARLVTTLGNRLGFDHVRKFAPRDSHLPEREAIQIEAVSKDAETMWRASTRMRPIKLYPYPEYLHTLEPGRPPKKFQWRRQVYTTDKAKGPERLTPEWWRKGEPRVRDYWRVETANGPRLWLLTYPASETPEWFVAGRFP